MPEARRGGALLRGEAVAAPDARNGDIMRAGTALRSAQDPGRLAMVLCFLWACMFKLDGTLMPDWP
jgi:hypothetical protein